MLDLHRYGTSGLSLDHGDVVFGLRRRGRGGGERKKKWTSQRIYERRKNMNASDSPPHMIARHLDTATVATNWTANPSGPNRNVLFRPPVCLQILLRSPHSSPIFSTYAPLTLLLYMFIIQGCAMIPPTTRYLGFQSFALFGAPMSFVLYLVMCSPSATTTVVSGT